MTFSTERPQLRSLLRIPAIGIAIALVVLVTGCSDAPTNALSTSADDPSVEASDPTDAVVQVAPPGTDDFQTLQSAIDAHPGAILRLQPGTYDIGAERLTIPHGLTLQGAKDATGTLLSTIEGGDAVGLIHVRALGEYANDKVTLRNLSIRMRDLGIDDRRAAILHRAFDYEAEEFLLPGGGDLTVRGCEVTAGDDPEAKAYWSFVVEDVAITLEGSTFTSGGDFAVLFDGATYSSLTIQDNTVAPADAGLLMNAQDVTFIEGQDPSKTGVARFSGNTISVGTRAVQGFVNVGLNIISPRGPTFATDNVLSVPGSDNIVAVGMQLNNTLGQPLTVEGNDLRGGRNDDGRVRLGITVTGDRGRYANNVFQGVWSTGVIVALPLLPDPGAERNTFLHNDFATAHIAPHTQPQLPPLPAVHWWMGPEAIGNRVTDNSRVDQRVLDTGSGNHFQGTSFLPDREKP